MNDSRRPVRRKRQLSGDSPSTPVTETQAQRLKEIIDLVVSTAKAKGWKARVTNRDKVTRRFATVHVERSFQKESFYTDKVTGTLDVSVDDTIRVTTNKTSFYGHGLDDLGSAIQVAIRRLPWVVKPEKAAVAVPDSHLTQLMNLLRRLHLIARQLKHRHDNRESLVIRDEYDVQDLVHALLKGHYDDVRAEEYTPSYAGANSRVDFLLKKEKCVIETKMASGRLRDRVIGEQLILDIKRYQTHPDCATLVCFVYDPDGFVKNPAGLETDLSRKHDALDVRVVIVST